MGPAATVASARATAPEGAAQATNPRVAQRARAAAQEFESVFLTTMLENMFGEAGAEPPFGGGESEKTYRSMMVGEYAKDLARRGGLGVADFVYREIIAAQEGSQQ